MHRHRNADGGDLLEVVHRGTTGTEVLLVGHDDAVRPRGTLAQWPFEVRDGSATGPGVFDMKAGLVTGAHARHEHVLVGAMPDRAALVAGVLHRLADRSL